MKHQKYTPAATSKASTRDNKIVSSKNKMENDSPDSLPYEVGSLFGRMPIQKSGKLNQCFTQRCQILLFVAKEATFKSLRPLFWGASSLLENLKIIDTKCSRHVTFIFGKRTKFGNFIWKIWNPIRRFFPRNQLVLIIDQILEFLSSFWITIFK